MPEVRKRPTSEDFPVELEWSYDISSSLMMYLNKSRAKAGGTRDFISVISQWEAERIQKLEFYDLHGKKSRIFNPDSEHRGFQHGLWNFRKSDSTLRYKLAKAFLTGKPIAPGELLGANSSVASQFYNDLAQDVVVSEFAAEGSPLWVADLHNEHREKAKRILRESKPPRGPRPNAIKLLIENYTIVLIRAARTIGLEMTVGGNERGEGSELTRFVLSALNRTKQGVWETREFHGVSLEEIAEVGDHVDESRTFKDNLRRLIKDFG